MKIVSTPKADLPERMMMQGAEDMTTETLTLTEFLTARLALSSVYADHPDFREEWR